MIGQFNSSEEEESRVDVNLNEGRVQYYNLKR